MITAKLPTGPIVALDPGSTATRGEQPLLEQQLNVTVDATQAPLSPATTAPAPAPDKPVHDKLIAVLLQHVVKFGLPFVIVGSASGAGFVIGGAGGTVTDADLEELRVKDRDLESRVTDLEPLVDAVNKASVMSAMALEIGVESHKHTSDLIVSVGLLIDPDYKPPAEDVRLQRRLRQGQNVLDAIDTGVSKP